MYYIKWCWWRGFLTPFQVLQSTSEMGLKRIPLYYNYYYSMCFEHNLTCLVISLLSRCTLLYFLSIFRYAPYRVLILHALRSSDFLLEQMLDMWTVLASSTLTAPSCDGLEPLFLDPIVSPSETDTGGDMTVVLISLHDFCICIRSFFFAVW